MTGAIGQRVCNTGVNAIKTKSAKQAARLSTKEARYGTKEAFEYFKANPHSLTTKPYTYSSGAEVYYERGLYKDLDVVRVVRNPNGTVTKSRIFEGKPFPLSSEVESSVGKIQKTINPKTGLTESGTITLNSGGNYGKLVNNDGSEVYRVWDSIFFDSAKSPYIKDYYNAAAKQVYAGRPAV